MLYMYVGDEYVGEIEEDQNMVVEFESDSDEEALEFVSEVEITVNAYYSNLHGYVTEDEIIKDENGRPVKTIYS